MAVNILGRQAVFGIGSEEGIEDDADRLDIPIHAFDLVVADECHRGYISQELSVWRATSRDANASRASVTEAHARVANRCDQCFRADRWSRSSGSLST
jgi:type I restriction enzyme, R subunit